MHDHDDHDDHDDYDDHDDHLAVAVESLERIRYA